MKWAPWIIVIYMLSALCWWTYLLYSKNEIIYNQQIKLMEVQKNVSQEQFIKVQDTFDRQRNMIIGEGVVFAGALICGVFYLWLGYRRNLTNTRRQNNFLLSVTHELKSPLASIKLAFETIKKRRLSPEQNEKISENGIVETDRLHQQIENILTATSIDQQYSVNRYKTTLHEFIQSYRSMYKSRKGMDRVQFLVDIGTDGDRVIALDTLGLQKITSNFIENALKYSTGEVTVTYSITDENLIIAVADEGPGIPAAERTAIFNRFYRIGNEETRSSKGTGLGLYIVRHITNKNEGRTWVEENRPYGSVFKAEIKIA